VSKIEVGRYSELLRRLLSMKGVTEVSGELSPEISPVFILESERPEWEFLKGEKPMSSVFALAGVAAQNYAYRLVNPVGSGVMAVLGTWTITAESEFDLLIERNTTQGSLATVLNTVSRDTRYPIVNASACVASQATNVAASGQAWWSAHVIPNVPVEVRAPFVLLPGHQVQFSTIGTVNVSVRGNLEWLERRADVLEL